METPLRAETNKKSNKSKYKYLIIAFAFILLSSFSLYLALNFLPYFQQSEANLSTNGEKSIYFMGEKVDYYAITQGDKIYVPLDFFKEYIDKNLIWDDKNQLLVITTEVNVYHFPLGKTEGLLNLEPYSFTYPIIEHNGEVYLPVEPINDYYEYSFEYFAEKTLLIVHDLNSPLQQGQIIDDVKLREKPTLMSPWVVELKDKEVVNIMREIDDWYFIEQDNGTIGYIDKKNVKLTDIKQNDIKKEVYQPWNPIGEPIVLTWEYATKKTPDTANIGELKGVQVVSPTWFHLQKDGLVSNSADIEYVDWAHQNGYQVWGLFSNSFNPEITHEMLVDTELRIKVIKQLLTYVDLYKLDGINIDFENVNVEDKELLVQFARELTPLLHEKDRTVSIDVTFKSLSPNWSMFYDRKSLGETVDYVMVMAYDEHWATSPVAGSVASLPWVEEGLKEILEEVPNDKVILGIPFYTRLWIEEKDAQGNVTVKSETLTMEKAQEWIKEHNAPIRYDSASGQNYVELVDGNITYKIWLEDSVALEKRINIMKKYRLAGIATWRRGFESEDYWGLISDFIEKP